MIIRENFPYKIEVHQNIEIPLPDGTIIRAKLWMPVDAVSNPVPAIIEYIPYRQHDGTAVLDSLTHPYFSGHGYACLRVDIRGSGNSEGILRDEYLKQEQDDALAIMEWLSDQIWCTGSVGMIGISWGGFAALQIAARRPPQLKAIITCCSTDDRYTDDVHWMGGCLLNDSLSWGGGLLGGIIKPPDPMVVGNKWKDMWLQRLEINEPPLISWLRHQRKDNFWRHGSVCENYDNIECAVYAVGGWTDGYSNAIFRLIQNLSGPRRALVGPWTHVYPHFGEPGPAIGFLQDSIRWWDRWLKGTKNGVDEEPMINLWMQEALHAHPDKPEVSGRWIGTRGWPLAENNNHQLFINEGKLSSNSDEVGQNYLINSPMDCGLGGGEWCPKDSGGTGPEYQFDQREDDGRSTCFETSSLTEALEVLGEPKLSITLRSNQTSGILVARLCDIDPKGRSSRVTFGVLNLCHRNGSSDLQDIVPDEDFRITLSLNLVAYRFLPGHKIRLALSNTYWPMVWPSPFDTKLSFHSNSAKLCLPLNQAQETLELDQPFDSAECSKPLPVTEICKEKTKRIISRDAGTGNISLVHCEESGSTIDSINLTIERVMQEEFYITEGVPTSCNTRMNRCTKMTRGDWSVQTKSILDVSCDETNFFVSITFDVYDNNDLVCSKVWDERIPRDHV